MLDAVLRVYGEEFDVAQFLSQHTELVSSDSFNKGELEMFGNLNEFSGFDVIVAEQYDAETCLRSLHQFLMQHKNTLIELRQDEFQSVLDLDVSVESDEQIPDSLALPVELLGALTALNIAIEFSAYPSIKLN